MRLPGGRIDHGSAGISRARSLLRNARLLPDLAPAGDFARHVIAQLFRGRAFRQRAGGTDLLTDALPGERLAQTVRLPTIGAGVPAGKASPYQLVTS